MIDTPGVYEIDPAHYHADPCPTPSLSSGGVRRLLTATPAHFRAAHPRLSPWPIEDHATKEQDLGNVVHQLLLGRGKEIAVYEFDDWKTKKAQKQRAAARAEGQVPILQKLYGQALTIADAAQDQLRNRFGQWPFGFSEQTVIWQRRTSSGGKVWCRSLDDHMSQEIIVDLKTTGRSLADSDLAASIGGDGYDIQAAFYLDGLGSVFPEMRGRQRFIFAYVEVEPPYAVRFAELPNAWLNLAAQRIDRAVDLFERCTLANDWPSWKLEAKIQPPTWLQARWEAEISMEEGS